MDLAAAMLEGGRRQARWDEALSWNAWERKLELLGRMTLSMTPGPGDRGFLRGKAGSKQQMEHRKMAFTSSGASVCGRHDRPIPENIIGHGMRVFPERFSKGNLLLRLLRAFLLLYQPARQHGGGVFFHPKIEKSAYFLAEIGGMAEPREFKALQRVARSREKKLPRGLSFVMVHVGLLVTGAGTLTPHY
jgi:hypothetical protein